MHKVTHNLEEIDLGLEREDIEHSMRDHTRDHINWIQDCLVNRFKNQLLAERITSAQRSDLRAQAIAEYKAMHKKNMRTALKAEAA